MKEPKKILNAKTNDECDGVCFYEGDGLFGKPYQMTPIPHTPHLEVGSNKHPK